MRAFFSKKNLFLRVAVGFALGVVLGFAAPDFSIAVKVVGDLYLNLIKLMIIPIVVCAVFLRRDVRVQRGDVPRRRLRGAARPRHGV